jgi:hypothetical protein
MDQGPICKTTSDGTVWFNQHGKLHREDSIAIEWPDGHKIWHLNGNVHRVDGPAIDQPNGDKSWYLNGLPYTFDEWKVEVRKYYETQEDYLLMLLKL